MKLRPQKLTNGTSLGTITSHHFDLIIRSLVFKYLNNLYPVNRIKIKGKFKRCILINFQIYAISDEKSIFLPILITNLTNTFAIDEFYAKKLIFDYFKINKI